MRTAVADQTTPAQIQLTNSKKCEKLPPPRSLGEGETWDFPAPHVALVEVSAEPKAKAAVPVSGLPREGQN